MAGPFLKYVHVDRFQAVVHAALDCIICMDVDGKIREFNAAAEATFGYSRDEVIGQELANTIIPPELREQHRRGLAHYLKTGDGPVLGRRVEIPAVRADGARLIVELAITVVRTESGPFFTAYLRDITRRQRDEQRRAVLYAVARDLSAARRIEEVGKGLMAEMAKMGGWSFGAIWLHKEGVEYLENVVMWNDGSRDFAAFAETSRTSRFRPDEGLPGRVMTSHRIEWIGDVAADRNFPRRHAAVQNGLRGACALPLFVQGRVRGVIEFFASVIKPPDADMLNILAALGSNIGQFLERQFAEEELERQRHAAEAANAAKDQFIAMLSHELRAPLTPVLLWAGAAVHDPELARWKAEIEMLQRNIQTQARLVDDLLDVSRIRHGKITLRREVCDLNQVVEAAVQEVKPLAGDKGLTCTTALDQTAPECRCDPHRMRQVMVNLLQNACKFTPAGGTIHVSSGRNGTHVSIEVRDTGAGIPAADLGRIFQPFEQGETSGANGLGLGLAISKALVEMHGGSIEAESEGPGKGAVFRVRVPLEVMGDQ